MAQIDGNEITSRRTAAASALAARYLARRAARRLLVVGSGRVASLIPEAYRAVLPIEEITIWSRNNAAARRMADQLSLAECTIEVSADLAQAVREADVVSLRHAGDRTNYWDIRTVFKSLGTALEDLAAAIIVYESGR